jgi:hypothetical protein
MPSPHQSRVDRRYRGCQLDRITTDGALSCGGSGVSFKEAYAPEQREAIRGYIVAQAHLE